MSISVLALLLAAPVLAAEDEARALLEETLVPPSAAYSGQVSVTEGAGHRWLSVRYAPPGLWRRETLDRFGTPEAVAVSDGQTEWVYERRSATAWRGAPADADHRLSDPEEELALLLDNYAVRLATQDAVAGRPCRVLELTQRRGGALSQRLWVDEEEGLVLQRVLYGPDGKEARRMRFESATFAPARREDFRFHPPAGTRVVESRPAPDALELEEAERATGLKPRAPAWLPAGFVFESVGLFPWRGAVILHCRWTDGVDALSLFQAPARARLVPPAGAPPRPGRVKDRAAALSLLPDGKALSWSAGENFLLVGSLSADDLRRVAESVP